MAVSEIREVERKYNLWGGFRDEIVATALTLTLLVLGSFWLTERILRPSIGEQNPESEIAASSLPQTLGVQTETGTREDTAAPLLQQPVASEGAIVFSEVPYGEDGDYDFEGYAVSFRNPRVIFDAATNTKRKLVVNVWVKNKSMAEGIDMRLVASIIKDGIVIVPEAVLYITQPKTLGIGEEISFNASLSLIEGTDVRELKYKPGNENAAVSHFLYP